jgi:hypothetical protein
MIGTRHGRCQMNRLLPFLLAQLFADLAVALCRHT